MTLLNVVVRQEGAMSQEKPRKPAVGSGRAQADPVKSVRKPAIGDKPVKRSKSKADAERVNAKEKLPSPRRSTRSAGLTAELSEGERMQRISVAAYFRAEKRGFAPGGEIDDWISAEAEINQIVRNAGY